MYHIASTSIKITQFYSVSATETSISYLKIHTFLEPVTIVSLQRLPRTRLISLPSSMYAVHPIVIRRIISVTCSATDSTQQLLSVIMLAANPEDLEECVFSATALIISQILIILQCVYIICQNDTVILPRISILCTIPVLPFNYTFSPISLLSHVHYRVLCYPIQLFSLLVLMPTLLILYRVNPPFDLSKNLSKCH